MTQEFQELLLSLEAERYRPVPPVPHRTQIRPEELQQLVDDVAGPPPYNGKGKKFRPKSDA